MGRRGIIIIMDSWQWGGGIFGEREGGKEFVRCSGIYKQYGHLMCAELSVGTEWKTTDNRNPGTADKWERALFDNDMQRKSTNPGDELLLADDHLNQSGNITSQKSN